MTLMLLLGPESEPDLLADYFVSVSGLNMEYLDPDINYVYVLLLMWDFIYVRFVHK